MIRNDARNCPLTTASVEALAEFEKAQRLFSIYAGDPLAALQAATDIDPAFALAHVMRAHLLISGAEMTARDDADAALKTAERYAAGLTAREGGHLAAARAWFNGDLAAASRIFDAILADHPRDLLALQMGHTVDFYLGDSISLRDRVARVLPHWNAGVPGFGHVQGMHAFGLEEMGDYAAAERTGRAAVELDARDAWAVHAVAHVMEMEGRSADGIAWLTETQPGWVPENFFATHNWWHLALFHLDRGEADQVLELYDAKIRAGRSPVVLDMVDASAMLWRLNLLGVDLGNRPQELAEDWAPRARDGLYAFSDAHAAMAFLLAGRCDLLRDTFVAMDEAAADDSRSNGMMTRDVGLPLVRALHAFTAGRYTEAVEGLRRIKGIAVRFGGSNAQRDLIHWTMTEAALRDGDRSSARCLVKQRATLKPNSVQAARMLARLNPGEARAA